MLPCPDTNTVVFRTSWFAQSLKQAIWSIAGGCLHLGAYLGAESVCVGNSHAGLAHVWACWWCQRYMISSLPYVQLVDQHPLNIMQEAVSLMYAQGTVSQHSLQESATAEVVRLWLKGEWQGENTEADLTLLATLIRSSVVPHTAALTFLFSWHHSKFIISLWRGHTELYQWRP